MCYNVVIVCCTLIIERGDTLNEATGSVVTVRAKKRDVSHKEKIRVVTTKKTKRVVLSDDVKKIRKEFELDELLRIRP